MLQVKLLIVEDEIIIAETISAKLKKTGYAVTEIVSSGEDAILSVKQEKPDLILMDIQLPLMDGYEATRRIKADPELKNIPIIAVTSYALSGDDGKAHAAGCDGYVTKPYSPRELLAKIRQCLPQ